MKLWKNIVFPVLSLTVICLVSGLLLSLTHSVTSAVMTRRQQAEQRELLQSVFSQGADFEEKQLTDQTSYYVALDGSGQPAGYVFTTQANGYAGAIVVLSAFDTQGAVTGIRVLEANETAGLGANAKEDWFQERYQGTTGPLKVVKEEPAGENEIVAITNATITTQAVTDAVNDARELYHSVKGGAE